MVKGKAIQETSPSNQAGAEDGIAVPSQAKNPRGTGIAETAGRYTGA